MLFRKALNKVLFPTLGNPTIPAVKLIITPLMLSISQNRKKQTTFSDLYDL